MEPEKTVEITTQEKDKVRIHIYARGIIVERGAETHAFLAGVRVPDWLVLKSPEDIDPREFFRLKNPGVRSRFIRRLGIKQVLSSLGGRVVDGTSHFDLIVFNFEGKRTTFLRDKRSGDPWELEELDPSIKTVKAGLFWWNLKHVRKKLKERAWLGLHY